MGIRTRPGLLALLAFCAPGVALPAAAQDLVLVAPRAAKVEYEDARVRVVRLRLAPRESLPMHDRPARVVLPLTPNDVTTTRPDGTTSAVHAAAGKAVWSESAKRSVLNLDAPLENIVIELKQAKAPARPLPGPPSPQAAGTLDDPFHHWSFENQYVRVHEIRIPPGAVTVLHTHAFDSVLVQLSGGATQLQPQGGDWQPAESLEAGAVRFSADSARPRVHRERNQGAEEYRAILVQLLP
jgi:hypothetical protein